MFYVFEFRDIKKRLDEFGNRDGTYFRFRQKSVAHEFAKQNKRRIIVPSCDKELKMLKHRQIIDSFCFDVDCVPMDIPKRKVKRHVSR